MLLLQPTETLFNWHFYLFYLLHWRKSNLAPILKRNLPEKHVGAAITELLWRGSVRNKKLKNMHTHICGSNCPPQGTSLSRERWLSITTLFCPFGTHFFFLRCINLGCHHLLFTSWWPRCQAYCIHIYLFWVSDFIHKQAFNSSPLVSIPIGSFYHYHTFTGLPHLSWCTSLFVS